MDEGRSDTTRRVFVDYIRCANPWICVARPVFRSGLFSETPPMLRTERLTSSASDNTSSSFLMIVSAASPVRFTRTGCPFCASPTASLAGMMRQARATRHCRLISKFPKHALVVRKTYCKDGSWRTVEAAVPSTTVLEWRRVSLKLNGAPARPGHRRHCSAR